ncbi:MAG: ribonuclease, partial [Pseudomonadota bacterium]|nr:ribonuclease [Pseudomonadota bacterium]
MPEWLWERGIGEARAALVEDDRIVETAIELDEGLRLGAVMSARRTAADRVTLADGAELQLVTSPRCVPQGATLTVEIVREAIPEAGRAKLPRCAPTDAGPRAAPDLHD